MIIKKITIGVAISLILVGIFAFLKYPQQVEQKISSTSIVIENVVETIAPQPTKIQDDGLPNKYQINTAFIEQAPEKNWDQPWQDACEEAALLTADYYYQKVSPGPAEIKQKILDMIDFEKEQGWEKDINLEQMSLVGSKYLGYDSKIITDPTVDEIKKYIAADTPVIVPAAGKILYKENKHFKNGGPDYHAIVILGYNDDKKQFTVHDVGTQFGKYFRYSYNLLLEANHDLPVSGDKKDINSGDKKMLILLKYPHE